jgi:hypothetical protein
MNPFKYGQIVKGENFCPRPDLEKKLKSYIQQRQNVLVRGERRTGKSSLIFKVATKAMSNRVLIIDLFQIKTGFDLQKRILSAIQNSKIEGSMEKLMSSVAHLKPQLTIDQQTGMPSFNIAPINQVAPESIEGLLKLVQQRAKQNKLTVVFDEFQDIVKLPDHRQVLAVMRGIIQYHDNICYIYSGSVRKQIEWIFEHPESPFFKSAAKMTIGAIPAQNFNSFLTEKFRAGKRKISQSILEKIMETAAYIPGDIQEYCSAIWSVSDRQTEITDEILDEALTEIFSSERPQYEAHIQCLTSLQLRCLTAIANNNNTGLYSAAFRETTGAANSASVKKSINVLEEKGLLYQHEGSYKFANPFFRLWLAKVDL